MTILRWKNLKRASVVLVTVTALLALSSWPVNRFPSSTFPAAPAKTELTHFPDSMLRDPSVASPSVAVIGTGLAGLSAAYEVATALQATVPHAKVVVFEKTPNIGGNSAKASSGINAVNAAADDSPEAFASDTVKSAGGLSTEALVTTLAVSTPRLPCISCFP